jgi:hypothetical protein
MKNKKQSVIINHDIACIAFEFARRKIRFHKDTYWKDIECFGLFTFGSVSKYLVGNPANIKGFKGNYIKTNMRKENKIIWCQPTDEFWDKYIQPIFNYIENMDYQHKLRYVEDEGVLCHYEEYKRLVKENENKY